MLSYIGKRLLQLIPTMLIPTIIVFLLIFFSPGDPASMMLGPDATEVQIAELSSKMGYDQPVHIQLWRWLGNLLHGDLGNSIFLEQPVTQAISEHLGPTIMLTLYSMIVACIIGITLGIITAVKRGTAIDQIGMVFSVIGVSMPEFWLGLNLILLFSVKFRVLPIGGYTELAKSFSGNFRTLCLPALSLGLTQSAFIARMVRSSVIDVLDQDYVRTAHAKGLPNRRVVMRHVLKNAMVPTVTVVGMTFSVLVGGAVAIESVFNIPGIGKLLMNAVLRRDYPLIQGVVLYISMAYIIVNLIVDLIYVWIDPRIEY